VPYLTPQELPEGDVCRPLSIPADSEWLALFGGALTELTKPFNWEFSGGLTVAETIEQMENILALWYAGGCDCQLPGGSPIFRIGEHGLIEQYVDGEWVEPEGDFTIPPTEPRTEPTEQDRLCMAASNANYALSLLYENISDSIGMALDAAEAAARFVAAVGGGIGLVLGVITGGMIQTAGVIFAGVYAGVEFVTADLWDTEFSEKFKCILLACASEEEDVVHFDMDCVIEELTSQTTVLDPTLSDLRLMFQIRAMLGLLGSQALDAAGATTAIETDDCDACTGCQTWIGEDLADWEFFCCFASGGDRGHFADDELWSDDGTETGGAPNSTELMTRIVFPAPGTVTKVTIAFGATLGTFEGALGEVGFQMIIDSPNDWYNGTVIDTQSPTIPSTWVWEGSQLVNDEFTLWMFAALFSNAGEPSGVFGQIDIFSIEMCFDGGNPFA